MKICNACGEDEEFFKHSVMREEYTLVSLCKKCHEEFRTLLKKKLSDKKRNIYSEGNLMEKFLLDKQREKVIFT